MKQLAKKFVVRILGWQVRRLRKKNDFMIIGVVGSIGKTSTKFAIAQTLKQAKVVRFQEGNYNDIVSVPLVFFGHDMPSLFNPFAWLRIFYRNERQLKKTYPYDVVVVELGTDAPGQIASFSRYLYCDIAVVTAITPEHMEFFANLDAVAKEELSVANYASELVINADLCPKKYYKDLKSDIVTYGLKGDRSIKSLKTTRGGSKYQLEYRGEDVLFSQDAYSLPEVYSAVCAVIIAEKVGLTTLQIKRVVSQIQPVSGRMRRLEGIKKSLILDDTYNASPVAVKAALDTIYAMKAPQKIAILGNMNELGHTSKSSHIEIGEYCEPEQLDLVITIGHDANKYLATAAKNRGCKISTFDDPYAAADFIKMNLETKALILAKGSQNGVFAEETVKQLLADPTDASKLVRQSSQWMKKKKKNLADG